MNPKTWILPLFVAGTLSGIYFLPSAGEIAESAVNMEMPKSSGEWRLESTPPSEAELGTLAPDTKFAKAICLRVRPGEFNPDGYAIPDRLDISIVLSGADINNSIHRPERCMPAQGHQITSSTSQTLKLSNGRQVPTRRLISVQTIPTNNERTEFLKLNCVTYYFFVGHDHVTNDHLGRTLIDMKDRIVFGMDQRWAYVSVSMWYGKLPWIEEEVNEAEADKKIREFITDFSEKQIDWDQIKL